MEHEKRVDLGPFTLEEAKEWLHHLEDTAWDASSRAGAVEFILGNLLLTLSKAKAIDGMAFIEGLQKALPMQSAPHQIHAEHMLAQLHSLFLGEVPGGYVLH